MLKVLLLGQGMAGTIFSIGVERVKRGEIEPYGVPLAKYEFSIDISEIEIIGSVDVDARKVGKTIYDVAKGLYRFENVPNSLKNVKVYPGIEAGAVNDIFPIKSLDQEGYVNALDEFMYLLRMLKPDVVIDVTTTQYSKPFNDFGNFEKAVLEGKNVIPSQIYAYLTLKYGSEEKKVAYINMIPAPIANDNAIIRKAYESECLVLGDDGATGATPLTADILEHLRERNRSVKSIAQFNIGGNTDFLALTNERRNMAKEYTKGSVVKDILGYDAPHFIKPTGFLKPLGDKKFVAMHIEYISFNGAIDEIIVNMRVNDSPALAGYMVDLVRLAKFSLEKGYFGTIYEINAFYMKKPGPPN
ncbi:MAG: myo-inositol-1-phosphate synthase, partial [Thermoprotei archaeon]